MKSMFSVHRLLIAAFLVALGLGMPISGQSQTTGPSDSLFSMLGGDEMSIREWAVTNRRCYTLVSFKYTNVFGKVMRVTPNQITTLTKFSTYLDFQKYVLTKSRECLETAQLDSTPATMLNFFTYVIYETDGSGINYEALRFDIKSIGNINMSDSTITDAVPTSELIIIPCPNLEELEIRVDSEPPFHFPGDPGIYPKQLVQTNMILLRLWYCTNGFHANFRVKAGGKSVQYLQNGRKLNGALVDMSPDHWLSVIMTPGSETVLQTSSNYKDWSDIHTFHWYEDIEFGTVPIGELGPSLFYRAISN